MQKKTKQKKSRHGHFKDTSGVSQILSLRFSSSGTTQISVSATQFNYLVWSTEVKFLESKIKQDICMFLPRVAFL